MVMTRFKIKSKKSIRKLNFFKSNALSSSNVPRSIEKLLSKTGSILRCMYIFSKKRQKSHKYLVRIWGKVNFPLNLLSKNLKIFLNFVKVFLIFGPNAQGFQFNKFLKVVRIYRKFLWIYSVAP